VHTFRLSPGPIDPNTLRTALQDPTCGGYCSFEGWVRNHNEGHDVTRLEYEAFEPLAIKEGERIVAAAAARFGVEHAACIHRIGSLTLGELAVWKKEHYGDGHSGWVNCERCATPTEPA
jgi:molybdopterin synthase catalytic subunit